MVFIPQYFGTWHYQDQHNRNSTNAEKTQKINTLIFKYKMKGIWNFIWHLNVEETNLWKIADKILRGILIPAVCRWWIVLKGLEQSIFLKNLLKSSRDGYLWILRVGPAGVCGVWVGGGCREDAELPWASTSTTQRPAQYRGLPLIGNHGLSLFSIWG